MAKRSQRDVEAALECWESLGSARYLIECLAPVGLQFASFLPLWFVAQALARVLDIPDDAPVIEQPLGIAWLALMFIAMWALMLLGFSLGIVCNILVARWIFGWPWAAVVEAGLCPAFLAPADYHEMPSRDEPEEVE